MIKNIVLDIGNVLIPFSWRQHLDHFGFSDEIKKRLADAVFLNDDWNEIDRGVLTKEELLARFIENDPGIEKETWHGALRGCRPAPGGHKAQRVPCGGDPEGRRLPDDGQRLFPAPDRCGPGSGGADLRETPFFHRAPNCSRRRPQDSRTGCLPD